MVEPATLNLQGAGDGLVSGTITGSECKLGVECREERWRIVDVFGTNSYTGTTNPINASAQCTSMALKPALERFQR